MFNLDISSESGGSDHTPAYTESEFHTPDSQPANL